MSHHFKEKKTLIIEELNCTLRELVHEPSGAVVMHVENDDPENLFCLSFQTLPYNSNGVAHILEHTVLCGSRNFPVKDPFFAMTRRSLNTFMNALTGPDFTCYPAASQVEKDFYNLLEVYLDAVFHPQLKKTSFLQEGHRLEFADPKNPKSLLQWKGIVFNEVKGSLSSPETRLWHAMMETLTPDLTYAHFAGGDPKEIPSLTYEELIEFHETYYHPSRCLFFFYGNLPLKKHLDFIEEKTLKHVAKQPPLPPFPRQHRFSKPIKKEIPYPITETEDLTNKSFVVFGWLTVPVVDQETVLALSVLDAILMDTDASPLKLPLLQSGLCTTVDAYIDTEMSEVPYLIVCKGCLKEDADALEATLRSALSVIIEEGIPSHLVDAAIHQLEFSRTEIGGDQAPYGLTLFMRAALAKQHDCPPENALQIHSLFDKLLKRIQDPMYLPGLLKKHFLNNPHFCRMVMFPDPELPAREAEEENKKLASIQDHLTPQEKAELVKQAEELAKYQKATEGQNLECLPKVDLDDVPALSRDFSLTHKSQIFHHTCFTNSIVYADLIFDLSHFTEEELPYVQLLTSILSEIGAGKRSYTDNLEYLQAHTGGVGAGLSLHLQATNHHEMRPSFMLRGKALYRKADKLFTVMKEIVTMPRLDEEKRVEELILQINTALQNRLTRSALRYATQLALSGFSPAAKINNIWHGLDYFKTIQMLAEKPSLEMLFKVKDKLLSCHNPHLVLSCDEKMRYRLESENYFGLLDLPQRQVIPWKGNYETAPVPSQARPIASPVAFTCEAHQVATYVHPHAPALSIATHLLDNKILHPQIREQGGAYGAGASYNSITGHFTFHAVRDPHIANTLKIFSESIETIASGTFTDRDLEEAKLGMIQQFDAPIAPGSRAATAYAWWREGKPLPMRQKYRDALLSLTRQEVKLVVEKELLPKKEKGVVVTFASQELIEKESLGLPIIPVLS
jgi:Zn-dependent M16 (insulinase) family peptidase